MRKTKLLLTLAALLLGLAPGKAAVNVSLPETEEWTSGTTYYIYNVGMQAYLTSGNAWDTHAMVDALQETNAFQWTISGSDGAYTIHQVSRADGENLYNDTNNDVWCDKNLNNWKITKSNNGYYTIQNNTNSTSNYLGAQGYSFVGTNNTTDDAYAHWVLVSTSNIGVFNAKVELLRAITYADGLGTVSDAVTTAESAFSAADATAETLKAALKTLVEAIEENASESSPVDVSFLGRNLSFSAAGQGWQEKPAGWTQTTVVGGGGNYRVFASATDYYVYENWASSTYTGKVYQTLTNLPAGSYKVTMEGFAGTPANVTVYAGNSSTAFTSSSSTAAEAVSATSYVEDGGSLEFGMSVNTAVDWCGFKSAKVEYLGNDKATVISDYEKAVENANAVDQSSAMSADDLNTLQDAINNYGSLNTSTATIEEIVAATEALTTATTTANTSIEAYETLKKTTDAMKVEMDNTNIYTENAYNTFKEQYDEWVAAYEARSISAADAKAAWTNTFTDKGWQADNTVDDFLLSAWTFGDTQCKDYTTNLYINTWSIEGDNSGYMVVPFFEYWTKDAETLGSATMTGSVEGLDPGKYKVTLQARVRLTNDNTNAPTGITANLNDGTSVDLCTGTVVDENQPRLYWGEYTVEGEVTSDGKLALNIVVDGEGNNISWLAFKYAKYEYVGPLTLTLDETSTEDAVTAYKDETVDVTWERTIIGGIYNAVCLPFALSADDITATFGEGAVAKTYTGDSYDETTDVITLTFTETTDGVAAGVPFIVMTSASELASNTFTGKTIEATTAGATTVGEYYNLKGTFAKYDKGDSSPLTTNDYIMGTSGKWGHPSADGNSFKGYRAYIKLTGTLPSQSARVAFDIDGKTTFIDGIIDNETANGDIYNLRGQKVSHAQKGVYIQNGKKRVIK